MESVRINKYLSEAGICSRREADRQLEAGNIYINNQMAKPGDRVNPGDEVRVNGQVVHRKEAPVLLAFYKPVGLSVPHKSVRSRMSLIISIMRLGFIRSDDWTKSRKDYCF